MTHIRAIDMLFLGRFWTPLSRHVLVGMFWTPGHVLDTHLLMATQRAIGQ